MPVRLLQRVSPIELYLPYHHLVTSEKKPYISNLYPFKDEKLFEKDLDYLLKYFHPVGIDEVVEYAKGNITLPKNSFLVTFDDGLKEVHSVIAPMLLRKGIPAVFFLVSSFIDNPVFFYNFKTGILIEEARNRTDLRNIIVNKLSITSSTQDNITKVLKSIHQNEQHLLDEIAEEAAIDFDSILKKERPFLTTMEAHQLAEQGFYLGGHSITHPHFEYLSPEEQIREVVFSTNEIAREFNQKYKLFAFPHSDKIVDQATITEILKSGIDLLFGIQNQLPELSNKMLHRFNAERPHISLEKQIKAEMLLTSLQKLTGKYKVHRR